MNNPRTDHESATKRDFAYMVVILFLLAEAVLHFIDGGGWVVLGIIELVAIGATIFWHTRIRQ